jgi:hypothetical protein
MLQLIDLERFPLDRVSPYPIGKRSSRQGRAERRSLRRLQFCPDSLLRRRSSKGAVQFSRSNLRSSARIFLRAAIRRSSSAVSVICTRKSRGSCQTPRRCENCRRGSSTAAAGDAAASSRAKRTVELIFGSIMPHLHLRWCGTPRTNVRHRCHAQETRKCAAEGKEIRFARHCCALATQRHGIRAEPSQKGTLTTIS